MLGLQIDGEGINSIENLAFDLELAQGTVAGVHTGRHATGGRIEIPARSNHLFRQRVDIAAQLKQVAHRVVVLVAVHPPHHHRLEGGVLLNVFLHHPIEEASELLSLGL